MGKQKCVEDSCCSSQRQGSTNDGKEEHPEVNSRQDSKRHERAQSKDPGWILPSGALHPGGNNQLVSMEQWLLAPSFVFPAFGLMSFQDSHLSSNPSPFTTQIPPRSKKNPAQGQDTDQQLWKGLWSPGILRAPFKQQDFLTTHSTTGTHVKVPPLSGHTILVLGLGEWLALTPYSQSEISSMQLSNKGPGPVFTLPRLI